MTFAATMVGGPGAVDAAPDPADNLVRGIDMGDSTRFDRWAAKVRFTDAGCWEWTAARDRTGYGRFLGEDRRSVAAHRYGYEQLVGPIPAGMDLDHLCRNRGCVRPEHLEPVTRRENLARRPQRRIPGAPWRRPPRVGAPKLTEAERFWAKVHMVPCGGCWIWTAGLNTGYGSFGIAGRRTVLAHRWAYENEVGLIPEGLVLDHLCINRTCVNPMHLEPVTMGENTLRGRGPSARNAVKTHCPEGHEYSEENTYRNASGGRSCRACRTANFAAWAARPENAERLKEKERQRSAVRYGGRKRGWFHKAKTHCPQGHPYDEANTCVKSDGRRSCRACAAAYMARRRAERRSA